MLFVSVSLECSLLQPNWYQLIQLLGSPRSPAERRPPPVSTDLTRSHPIVQLTVSGVFCIILRFLRRRRRSDYTEEPGVGRRGMERRADGWKAEEGRQLDGPDGQSLVPGKLQNVRSIWSIPRVQVFILKRDVFPAVGFHIALRSIIVNHRYTVNDNSTHCVHVKQIEATLTKKRIDSSQ